MRSCSNRIVVSVISSSGIVLLLLLLYAVVESYPSVLYEQSYHRNQLPVWGIPVQ
jgi:hypothetical protein